MASDLIRLRDVAVERDGRRLLDGVDWRVRAGERWVLLGPNGAGKTTLLQLAGARIAPSAGTVGLLGEQALPADPAELRTRIGLASAAVADALPAGSRVLDVVMTAAYDLYGRGAERYEEQDRDRALTLLGQFGCRTLTERRFGTLSEGERKRVQIARSLMTDPELLLLDEPAAGLDLGAREALLRRLSRLAADPDAPTTVLVSHHVEEIPAGTTHALLLRRGTVLAAGPIAEVVTAPLLSACFGVPLDVTAQGGRFTARIAPVRALGPAALRTA